MPELTPKQATFAREFVSLGSAREAARRAGYAQSVCDNAGREILGSDAVQQAVSELRRETQQRVSERLAAAAERAAATLIEIAENPESPATARIRSAVEILDRGGVVCLPAIENRQWDLARFLDLDGDEDAPVS